jgi:hypothetical protein
LLPIFAKYSLRLAGIALFPMPQFYT